MASSSFPPTVAAGFDALEKNLYESARAAFERALSEGHGSDVLVSLGWLLEQGLGGEKNVQRAMALYRSALSEASASDAAYYLGLLLMRQGDQKEGAELLQRAAEAGNASAAYWLYAFSSDMEGPEAQAVAEKSLVRAADLGHVYARRDLARRRMRDSKDLGDKLSAWFDYWKAGASAIALTIRDVDDRRVR